VSHVGGPPDVFAHSGGPNGALSFNQVGGPGGTPFTSALGWPVTSAPECVLEVASTACWFACDGRVTPRATDAKSPRLIARAIAAMPRTFVMRVVNSVSVAAAPVSLISYGTLMKKITEGPLRGHTLENREGNRPSDRWREINVRERFIPYDALRSD